MALAEAVKASLNKTIARCELVGDVLRLTFDDGSVLRVFDDGQECCEDRYMTTDDDLAWYEGAQLLDIEVRDVGEREDNRDAHEVQFLVDAHEVQFLVVTTTKGAFTMETHNEHNGYYGGFDIKASLTPAKH